MATRLGTGPLSPRYLRYKPGETCTAQFDDGGAGIIVRAVTAERYAIYREREGWRRKGGPVRLLDDVRAVAMLGSLDRGIRSTRRLLDPERVGAVLAALLGPGDDHLHVLRHKPGRRLVARIDRSGRPHALLKAVPPSVSPALLAAAQAGAAAGGPPILGHDAERGLLAQGWIAGETADPRTAAPEVFARIGAALAALHCRPTRNGAPPRPHPAVEALAALGVLLPDLSVPARVLADALVTALAATGGAQAFCHGDFSADQVVISGDGVRIIDWDRSGPGPALADLGSFLARLDADVLEGSVAADRAETLGLAFVAGYGRGASVEGVAPWRAAALAALAAEPFRARRSDWAAAAAAILDRAARLLGPAGLLARILDRAGMERAISAALGRSLRLDPPELLRERLGRRALVAYRCREADGARFEAYGKLRVKRLDRRTPALHRRLAAFGFGCDAGVPEALGILPETQIWLQAKVEGRLLTALLAPNGETAPLAAAGRALARLHRISLHDLPDLRAWSMEDELAVLADALDRAAQARPQLAAPLRELSADLAARARALPPGLVTGIHRDFYPDQVIVGAAKTWLLDLDLFSAGDPAIDVANFVAHLHELGLRRWGDPATLARQEAAFLAAYAAIAPLPFPARLELLTAISFARHAWISIRSPGRGHVTEAVITLCVAKSGG